MRGIWAWCIINCVFRYAPVKPARDFSFLNQGKIKFLMMEKFGQCRVVCVNAVGIECENYYIMVGHWKN